jgi:pentatricopeptide repeat protein
LARQRWRWSSTSSTVPKNVFVGQQRGPWNFKHSTYDGQSFSGSLKMRHRKERLAKLAERGQFAAALDLLTKWKKNDDFKPDLDIYNSLLAICSTCGLPNDARAFLTDMLLMKIKPDVNSFYHLLKVRIVLGSFYLMFYL